MPKLLSFSWVPATWVFAIYSHFTDHNEKDRTLVPGANELSNQDFKIYVIISLRNTKLHQKQMWEKGTDGV